MQSYKEIIRTELPKIYSQDLINNLFKHPYTKTDFIVEDLGVTRQTASRYLDQLTALGGGDTASKNRKREFLHQY